MPKQVAGRLSQGYILLADISGYTEFFTGTELEHAQEIIRELTSLIRERLTPPLRFVKLEGDAVFCYAATETFGNGERFVELIEACYFDFANRLDDMARSTICSCNACAAIDSLGLKFVVHHGTFIVERDGNREDLAGPDVILAHRLLKNSIGDDGGPRAYAFFTAAALQLLPPSFALPEHAETYESFGETRGGVHDLGPVLAAMREQRREYITSEAADFETSFVMPVPPRMAWQYVVDPMERLRWVCNINYPLWPNFGKAPDTLERNADGRTGSGAKTHCGHAPKGVAALREFVDWRPFSYFTFRIAGMFDTVTIETWEFESKDSDASRVTVRYRLTHRRRISVLVWRMFRPLYAARMRRAVSQLKMIAQEDAATLGLDDVDYPPDNVAAER